jgi:hypothetical protein
MSRTALIIGLMLLAALVPLATLPAPIAVVVDITRPVLCDALTVLSADAQPVALLSLTHFRAPPASR